MCDRKGCERPGIYAAGFTFEAVGGSVPVEAMSGLRLCQPCRDTTTLEDFLTPEAVQKIQDMLRAARLAPADPSSFKLRFVAVN